VGVIARPALRVTCWLDNPPTCRVIAVWAGQYRRATWGQFAPLEAPQEHRSGRTAVPPATRAADALEGVSRLAMVTAGAL
jgi:hypothetical protein